jgi:hypothetical protein
MTISTYKSVLRCIYCGASEYSVDRMRLGDEHIVPEGLNGKLILPEASCASCENVTKSIEGYCLRTTLGALRNKLNVRTKRPKERPTKLPTWFLIDGKWQVHEVPIRDYPLFVSMPYVPPPALLDGGPPSEEYFKTKTCHLDFTSPAQIKRLKRRYGATQISVNSGAVRMDMLSRLIAKIGRAYATAEFGHGMFRPLLLNIIKGNLDDASYLIGGSQAPMMATFNQHILGWQTIERNHKFYIVVAIRLFADLGFPLQGFRPA